MLQYPSLDFFSGYGLTVIVTHYHSPQRKNTLSRIPGPYSLIFHGNYDFLFLSLFYILCVHTWNSGIIVNLMARPLRLTGNWTEAEKTIR